MQQPAEQCLHRLTPVDPRLPPDSRHEHCVAECNGQSKKWNRDLLAVLNFRRIWNAYVSGNDRPQDLRRGRLPMSMSCANVDN